MTELTGPQKAAIVLTQMPQETAATVLRQMSEMEVSRVSRVIADLPDLEPGPVREVMSEFLDRVQLVSSVHQGGVEAARRMLRERLGAARAEEELDALLGSRSTRPFAFLAGLDPAQIAAFLADEHPQATAVVIAHLSPDLAAGVLGALEEDRRADVALRIGTLGKVPPDALATMTQAMGSQLLDVAVGAEMGSAGGGPGALAAILNRSDRGVERHVLGRIEAFDAELAEEIHRRLFTFEDVTKLDDRTLQKVVRNIQPKTLALALKGMTEEVQEVFLRNLSEGAAKDLTDEISYLGTVRVSEVEGAQMDVARAVRELEAAGEITIVREGDDVVS